MQTNLEITEEPICKLIPAVNFTPPIQINDLILSTFGHASAFLFSTLATTDTSTPGAIFNNDYPEPKPIAIIYLNKEKSVAVVSTTQFFKPIHANTVCQILFTSLMFSRAIILDSLPTLGYQLGKYKENVLIWVGTNGTTVADKRIQQIDTGEIISGISGAFLILAEMCSKACYVFIGIMQEYSVGKDTLHTFAVLGELVDSLKIVNDELYVNTILTNTNNKLASHSFT